MSGKPILLIYCTLLLLITSPWTSYAMELTLDERIPHSQKKEPTSPPQKNVAIPPETATYTPAMPVKETADFHFWWLLLLPAILCTLCLGWFIGHIKNQKKSPQEPAFFKYSTHKKRTTSKDEKSLSQKTKQRQNARKKQINPDDIFDFSDLNKAYSNHRFGRKKDMLDIMHKAFKHDPFDLNIYIISLTILSESDEPSLELTRLLRTGLFLLRTKRPFIWEEVAKKGRDLMPDLEDWSWSPE